jgi:hypothetical protein
MTTYGATVAGPSIALRNSVPEVVLAMRGLVPSAEPAVVLSSLARSCVPSFSDGCSVELSEGTDPMFHVSYPLRDEEQAAGGPPSGAGEPPAEPTADTVVTTSFEMRASSGCPSYAGVMVHSWHAYTPAGSDSIIARLLVDRAIGLIQHERLAEAAASADERSAQLALETMTSRAIGEATGIIMTTRNMTNVDAFDVLKKIGRRAGRNVYDIALEVVRAGALEHPPDRATAQMRGLSSRRPNLRTVRVGEL